MPTMWVSYAYISLNTSWDDVDFYVSQRYSRQQLKEYVYRVKQRAETARVRLLEFTIHDGDKEIWRGMV